MIFREGSRPAVVVAIATFRRPQLLGQTLAGVTRQAALLDPSATILVVDNDPASSAAAEAATWADRRVRYVCEAEPGISAARNRALREAGDADAVVFIDDDEVPADGWLQALVSAWQRWGCVAVAGPVDSEFLEQPDPWIAAIGLFARRRRATGSVIRAAATNNLLLDVRRLRELNLTFDARFGLSGGSDSMLTHRLSQAGGTIRWCDEAVVRETVPVSRTSRAWVRRRLLRTSNSWARVQVLLGATAARRWATRVTVGGHAALVAGRGLGRYCWGAVAGDLGVRCSGERDMLNALGVMAGVAGVVRYEYARRGGRPVAAVGADAPSGGLPRRS